MIGEQAEVVRRIFRMYLDEGMGSYSIAVRLTDEGIPTQNGKLVWLQSRVHHILGNAAYTGTWLYGKYRHVSTEDGIRIHDQPEDTWIEIPIPQIIEDETWGRAQALKKQRSRKAKRNTKVLYLLQHLLKCGECGHNFHARATWSSVTVRNGKRYRYDLPSPNRYYMCNGMQSMRLDCRERPNIRAERLEEPIWAEVKRVIQNPGLIVAGIEALEAQEDGSLEKRWPRRSGTCAASSWKRTGPSGCTCRGRSPRPSLTTSAGSSQNGWKAPGPGWTTAAPGRPAELEKRRLLDGWLSHLGDGNRPRALTN